MSPTASELVHLTIDGRPIEVAPGTTIFEAARRHGIEIPALCHAQHQTPVAVCRVCAVEVKNARVMAAACIRPVENGMEVSTATERVRQVRRTLYEVLLADHGAPCLRQQATGDCELETQAAEAGRPQAPVSPPPPPRGGGEPAPVRQREPTPGHPRQPRHPRQGRRRPTARVRRSLPLALRPPPPAAPDPPPPRTPRRPPRRAPSATPPPPPAAPPSAPAGPARGRPPPGGGGGAKPGTEGPPPPP